MVMAYRLGLLLGLLGCGFEPTGDQPLDPPAIYREWWAKTEACSGLTGEFTKIDWRVLPGERFGCASGTCVGHWQWHHRIWVVEAYDMHEMVVRHEMLHDLLGSGGHPARFFKTACGLTWDTWTDES